jgi:hypothetical protein
MYCFGPCKHNHLLLFSTFTIGPRDILTTAKALIFFLRLSICEHRTITTAYVYVDSTANTWAFF